MRQVTTQEYLDWLKLNEKGKHVRYIDIDLQNRTTYESVIKCNVEVDMSKYDSEVDYGFYSSYVFAAVDYIAKGFKETIANATKDQDIPDDKRIEQDAYISQMKMPVFQIYGIDDEDRMAVKIFVKGAA